MDKKGIRVPGIAVWMSVTIVLMLGACTFLVIAGIFAFRQDYLTAVLSIVATLIFLGGARFEVKMNDDYYLINDEGVIVIRNGKRTAMIRWEEFTQASFRRAPYKGEMWMYLDLRAVKERDGICVEDKRLSIPIPFSRRKQILLYAYFKNSKLEIDYSKKDKTEEINPSLLHRSL